MFVYLQQVIRENHRVNQTPQAQSENVQGE